MVACSDGKAAEAYPALWEYLTACLVGGTGRLTATLLVMCESGQVKLCLSDRETEQVAWASAGTVLEALQQMEEGLASGRMTWREKRPYEPKTGRSR